MEKQKDILLIFLLKEFCKNNGLQDKYNIIKKKLEKEKLIAEGLEDLTIIQQNTLINYFPPKKDNTTNMLFYENIGSGSFGNVFKTIHKLDKNEYAIKIVPVYNDMNESKYIKEVEMISKLDNPNIVRYYNSWTDDILPFDSEKMDLDEDSEFNSNSSLKLIEPFKINKFLFIQMELCIDNLNNYITNRTNINYIKSLDIFKNVCLGINYIHNKNIIHRDIKPSNIMFDKKGIVKIGDFGMSIKLDKDIKIIQSDNSYGTYNYLAPEVIKNKEYSVYSDVYSLGIILYELLYIFDTFMERQKKIDFLKEKFIVDDDFREKFTKESKFIDILINENKNERFTTDLILKKKIK